MHNPIVTAPIINRLRNSTKRHVVLEHARGDPGKIEPHLGAQVRTLRSATLPADNSPRANSVPGGDLTGLRFKSSSVHGPVAGLAVQEVKAANGPSLVHDLSAALHLAQHH
jgi:hypothetical protein